MVRTSAAVAAATASRVLEVATALFAAHGFAAVSLDDVAHAAGVTRGAVYHHYQNKTGLFRAVAARLQAEVAAAVLEAVERQEGDALDQLRAGSHAFLDAITAAPAARVLLIDAPAVIGWAEWRKLDAEHSEAHLRAGLAVAGVPAAQVDAMTVQLSGAMNEAALWLAQRPKNARARQTAHQVLDRILEAATR